MPFCLARTMAGARWLRNGSDVVPDVTGHRHSRRVHTLTGTFGKTEIAVPRAPLNTAEGKTTEWKSQSLRAYQRRTLAADALIAGTYLAGTNTAHGPGSWMILLGCVGVSVAGQ
jgi:hypothetical protein